jgi:hypothetical protein
MADWYDDAVKGMRELRVGDKIRVRPGRPLSEPGSYLYHVRGMVDDYLVVREWSAHKKRWSYTCLGPAWWSVFRKNDDCRITRGRRRIAA